MRNTVLNKQSKRALAIVIAVVVFALALVAAVVAIHAAYTQKLRAEITDFGNVNSIGNDGYVLYYDEGTSLIDLSEELKVNAGATLDVVKIKDEDGTVSKGTGTKVDVSVKSLRTAVLRVVSENGQCSAEYSVTVAPKKSENNVVTYFADDATSTDYVYTYSGDTAVTLPTPTKIYNSTAGDEVNIPFEGWYTDPEFSEESKVDKIEEGTSGDVTLYAKFADNVIYGSRDGYLYVLYGLLPQTRVTNYSLNQQLRTHTNNATGDFWYGGNHYLCYRPSNVPNLAINGYSSSSVYFFKYEPIEWRVMKPKGTTVSSISGQTVDLMATKILGGGRYCDHKGFVNDMYVSFSDNSNFKMDWFEQYFFDGNTMYHGGDTWPMQYSGIADDVNALRGRMTFSDTSIIQSRTFTYYKNIFNSTSTFSQTLWLPDYGEVLSESNGFSSNYKENDPVRKAYCTDYAAAQGVYRSTERGTKGQGSWWLRDSNTRKMVAYVKFTGYVHKYTASNYALLSGIRPCMRVTFNTSVLSVVTD